MDELKPGNPAPTTPIIDIAIRLGVIAFLVYLAMRVFSPFLGLMAWAVILAVSLYPLNAKLVKRMGGRSGRAATLLVLCILLVLGVPTVLLTLSLVDHAMSSYQALLNGTLTIRGPGPNVANWPIVGERVDATWRAASDNAMLFASQHEEQLREFSRRAVGALGGAVKTMLSFLAAFIVGGIMLAYAQPGADSTRRIFSRICGPQVGPELHALSVATIRSVAVGVVGVAFIQSVLLGVGFLIAGIPAAGLLALGVLVLGIMQLPAAIFVIPAIAWLWMAGDGGLVANIVLSVYLLAAGLVDNVLKPLLLGRGLAVPMPVILLGALGGMVTSGLVGLFVGAVILAVGYQVFVAWVYESEPAPDKDSPLE